MGSWTNATATASASARTLGILRPEQLERVVRRELVPVSADLERWVEHCWAVSWSLPAGSAFRSEVVSHPAVHLTFETGDRPRFGRPMPAALVHGVVTRRFTVDLEGSGAVFGVRFRPGGFGAFTGADVGEWTDRVVPAAAGIGPEAESLLGEVLTRADLGDRLNVVEDFLRARAPGRDDRYDGVLAAVEDIQRDPTLTTVELAARRHGLSERTLQRLFRRYVGVGPKWVLQRARLHDAVERIDTGAYADLASLAVELGWFDQAHFTRDFTALVGQSPAAYAARRDRG